MVEGGGPNVGDVVGPYVLKRLLGAGGMGLVYLAEHQKLKRKVALKLLRPELTSDLIAIRRFFDEARAVNEIAHENIVEITDFVDVGPHRYFVMELLQGHGLDELLARGERMPLGRTVHVAQQIAAALGAAHGAGVIHRDLKPPNVFLIKRGADTSFVKLLDFGIAKVLGVEPGDAEKTVAGTFIGTPSYMAPEQLSQKKCDHRVDIYAFGVLLFELCTGQRPFRSSSMAEIIVQQLTKPPPRPSEVMRGLPGGFMIPDKLEQLILACLVKNPEDRIKSMRYVERVLEEVTPMIAQLAGAHADKLSDGTDKFALPSIGGWVSVPPGSPALTTGSGFAIDFDDPLLAEASDVIEMPAAQRSDGAANTVVVAVATKEPLDAPRERSHEQEGAQATQEAAREEVREQVREEVREEVRNGVREGALEPRSDDDVDEWTPRPHGRATAIAAVVAAVVVVGSALYAVISSNAELDLAGAGDAGTTVDVDAHAHEPANHAPARTHDASLAAAATPATMASSGTVEPVEPVATVAPVAMREPPIARETTAPAAKRPLTPMPKTTRVVEPDGAVSAPTAPVDVSFTSKPAGATVVVNGKTLGVTPLTAHVYASTKRLPVQFKLEGHAPNTVMTVFAADAVVSATLIPLPREVDGATGSAKAGALVNPFKKKSK